MPEELVSRGLLNDGFVVLTPRLIERYNRCLTRARIPPTSRTMIRVDGAGWSPEVAEDLGNPLYLSNGVISPLAIIVDPEQFRKPHHMMLFSWARDAIDYVFREYHREIFDICVSHAILIDLDNGLSDLEDPSDLFLLSEIQARPDTGTLTEAAARQAELHALFRAEPLSCLDSKLEREIIENRRLVGDLRKRKVNIKPVTFRQFRDFHTVACNGAAVLRDVGGSDLLVLEDPLVFETMREKDGEQGRILHLYDEEGEPFRLLSEAGMLSIPIEQFKDDRKILDLKKEILLGMSLSDCEPGIDWTTLSSPSRRSLMQEPANETKVHLYHELERYAAAIRSGRKLPQLSHELWYYLLAPSEKLPPSTQEVLMILLTRKEPRRLLDLYTVDKNSFVAMYKTWSDQKKKWAAEFLAAHYKKRMNQR